VDQAPAGILFVGAGDGAVITNREASRIFGHPVAPGDECQQCLGQVRHPDGRPVDVDDLPTSRALRGERVEGTDHLVVQASGATIPIRWSAAAIRGSHGEIIGCVSVLHDVSAIKQLERLRGEWTSMVAHDLRQPVAAVTLAAQLLRQNPGTAPGIQRWVEEIVGSSRRLDRMVADLLDESRIETGRLRLKLEPVDPAALVTASVARLARAYPERAIRFGQSGPIPTMDLDPGRLDQVLTNLVTNAAKYGDDGTEIVVELDARGDAVELTVTNHGPGILPDELPRLFDRFYRTPRAEAGGADGLGLGLYITRGIVEAHGGRIWAESTPGQTTRFRVSLPYR
jgi:PAS domain S-box-containing protein